MAITTEAEAKTWLQVQAANIPESLRAFPQWVLWRGVWNDDRAKWDKRPFQPNGRPASSTDPETWSDFSEVMAALEDDGEFTGVGFVLTASDPFCGIDLDHCVDERGVVAPGASRIVDKLESYSEVSPSGTGIRIFVKGALPPGGRRKDKIELYDDTRFLTLTGHRVASTSPAIEHRQAELNALHAEIFGRPAEAKPEPQDDHRGDQLPDDAVIRRISNSKQAGLFQRLMAGDTTGYQSASEADLAMCNILAFWTGRNPSQMDSIFRRSGLMRPKWDTKHGAQTYGAMTIEKAIAGCQETYKGSAAQQQESASDEWERPIPLDLPDLPTFDRDDFPLTLWPMVEAVSKATETPVELAGMIALAVLATACQKKVNIEPEPGYREPLNAWTAAALLPASRKSAAMKPFLKPLHLWEIEKTRQIEPEIQKATAKRAAEELRLKELQKRFAKEDDPNRRDDISAEMEQAERDFTPIPTRPQIFTQDTTPERLGTLMAENGEAMAIFSTEGGIFDTMGGRYSNGVANLDVFLQAHAGDTVRVDRGCRPSIWLHEPALTMGLCIQPDVLTSMAGKPGFRGRGLVARFLYAMPHDIVGKRTLETTPIPQVIEHQYGELVARLLDMPAAKTLFGELVSIQLSTSAWELWKEFQRWVEHEMDEGGTFEHMRDWAGKLPGAAARICGLFHCCEHEAPAEVEVSADTMGRALSLAAKLSQHAVSVYDLMGCDNDIQAARKILRWIEKNMAESFTARDCHYALQGTFSKREDLEPGISILSERGYIRKGKADPQKRPGRKKEVFEVNPAVFRGKA